MDREPLYIQIQNHFKQLIASRQLQEDDKIPTEKEIIEQFNVSRITAANALGELARDGWIYRIPGRGSYVRGIPEAHITVSPSHASPAPAAPQQRLRKIGLLFPFVEDFFAIRFIRGINEVLEEQGYASILMFTHNAKEREKEVIRDLKEQVDGFVIFPVDAELYNEEIIKLKMSEYPFVLIDRYLPGVETNAVYCDSALGAKLAVEHLWDLGHRDIAICSNAHINTVSVEERIEGYTQALREKGAMINPALILTDFPSSTEGDMHPLQRFMEKKKATAYIALNSALGVQLWQMAERVGLRVPNDISIISFDNPGSELAELSPFTYIDQFEQEMGRKAGELILAQIRSNCAQNGLRRVVQEPKLVVQRTTGPVRNE